MKMSEPKIYTCNCKTPLYQAAPAMYKALLKLKECLEGYFGKTEKDFFEDCNEDSGELYFAAEYNEAINALKTARREEMNENEFELNGRWYAARDTDGICEGCAFESDKSGCDSTPPCSSRRSDGRNVIFVEVPKPKPKTNGDRIREMSNKDLADFLNDMADCSSCATAIHNFAAILQWLNRPAEEESEGK